MRVQQVCETPRLPAFGEPGSCFGCAAGGRQAGNPTFDDCQLHTCNAGRLTGTKNRGDGRFLKVIYMDETVVDRTSQQRQQFDVGNKMKTAGEIIACDILDSAGTEDVHAFESLLAACGDHPSVCGEGNTSQIPL